MQSRAIFVGSENLLTFLDGLRELTFVSVFLRLTLAVLFGGLIGLDRERKRRPAGFRTYMLVCLGAALTIVLSQYELVMMNTRWADVVRLIGVQHDVSRYGAQVINGIGFLGAGTIIITDHQAVKGLTTAAGLWASACMGLAIGACFYECVILGFVLIFLCIRLLPYVEEKMVERSKNMNIYVEFSSLEEVGSIISHIKAQNVRIYSVEINRRQQEAFQNPSAVFSIHLNRVQLHASLLAEISDLECIRAIDEI